MLYMEKNLHCEKHYLCAYSRLSGRGVSCLLLIFLICFFSANILFARTGDDIFADGAHSTNANGVDIFSTDYLEGFPTDLVDTFFHFGADLKPRITFDVIRPQAHGLYTVEMRNIRSGFGLPPLAITDATVLLKVDESGTTILASEHVKSRYVTSNFRYDQNLQEFYRVIGDASTNIGGTPIDIFYLFSDRNYNPVRIFNYRTEDGRWIDGHSLETTILHPTVPRPTCFDDYDGELVYVYTGAFFKSEDVSSETGNPDDTAKTVLYTPYVISDSLNRPLCEGSIADYGSFADISPGLVNFGADIIDLTHGNSVQLGITELPNGEIVPDPRKVIKSDKNVGVWQIDVETNTADFLFGVNGDTDFGPDITAINQHDARPGANPGEISIFINQTQSGKTAGITLYQSDLSHPPDSIINLIPVITSQQDTLVSVATGSCNVRPDGLIDMCAGVTAPVNVNVPELFVYDASGNIFLQGGADDAGIIPYQFHSVPSYLEDDAKVEYLRFGNKIWVSSDHDGVVGWDGGELMDTITINRDTVNVIVRQGTRQLYGKTIAVSDIPVQDSSISTPVINDVHLELNVYPNPTSGPFLVENISNDLITDIEVFNALGAYVYSLPIDGVSAEAITIDLSKYNVGIYFIRVSGNESSTLFKVIKQ